ncbi:hypothetical protein VPH35_124777 [Triticum aestivum]
MTRHTTCWSTSGSPDPTRILHRPSLAGNHEHYRRLDTILQLEKRLNFSSRSQRPAAGRRERPLPQPTADPSSVVASARALSDTPKCRPSYLSGVPAHPRR